jgi:hypothetical protein
VALVLTAGMLVALCLAFEPRFETNDDVAMSMIAHGYGDAAYGSPLLIYSDVLWGHVVRAVPTVNGVLGYSIATLAVLLVVGWALLHFLLRLNAGYIAGLLAVSLIIARPTLFPQFTINAGLLTVAAVIGWRVYARQRGSGTLVAACLLAFFGYLVRAPEFILVLGVAAPLLPWRTLRRRQAQAALVLLALAIGLAAAADRWSYAGPEWQRYFEIKQPVTAVAAWGYGASLKQHPEILARHGYSQNDMDLIGNAFWADPRISDPKSLNAMLTELGSAPAPGGRLEQGMKALGVFTGPVLLPLMLPALILFVITPRWSVAVSWVLCVAGMAALGVAGRPAVVRVYVPLASLLLVAPLVTGARRAGVRRGMAALTLAGAWIGNAYVLVPQARESAQQVRDFQRDMLGVPAHTIVNWANSVRHELVYPVLARDPRIRAIRLYDISAFTFAPFSVATAEREAGRDVIERLRTAEGIPMFTPYGYLWDYLRVYCGERWKARLQGEFTYKSPSLYVQQVRCVEAE